jgi:transposase
MAKPRSRPQLSLQAPHVYDDAPGIPIDHWSRAFFEHIFCGFDDAQFADLYVEGGRHPISPSLLAAITLLQYMFRASDRVAVENTLMRRDWRLALGIAPDYDGFDPTVLVNFRKRLVAHDMQRAIFEAVLERIAKLGLLKGRRRVRVDSTQLLADVARLSRADA